MEQTNFVDLSSTVSGAGVVGGPIHMFGDVALQKKGFGAVAR